MSLNNNFPFVPENVSATPSYWRLMMKGINGALKGKLNCTGTVTLTANSATTSVTDNRCLAKSVVLLQPTTVNSAGLGAGGYIVAAAGSFTINHPNNAQTDRTFNYVIIG